MIDLLLILLTAILLFVSFILPRLLRRATARRQRFEQYANVFYQKAAALSADDETPDELLSGVESMNTFLGFPAPGILLLRIFYGRPASSDETVERVKHDFDDVIAPFFERRPELKKAFMDAVEAWVFAMLCQGRGFSGFLARLLLGNSISLADPELVASRVQAKKMTYDHRHPTDKHLQTA